VTWADRGIPNPGSKEAGEQGCTCAVIDNHYGKGLTAGYGTPEEPAFWVSGDCPLHATKEEDAAGADSQDDG